MLATAAAAEVNMSETSESTPKHASANDSETSSGFRHFWKKSNKDAQGQDVKFVQQDPTTKRKANRISKLLQRGSAASSPDDSKETTTKTEAQKRRAQVYTAQKRHRNRKAEYVQNLEAEVARLQHLDSIVNNEKNTLAHQNRAIKEFLAQQSLDVHLESVNLNVSQPPSDTLSELGGANVDIRLDPDLGQDRVFLDFLDDDMQWLSEASTEGTSQQKRPARHAPVAGDAWAALDFILALEWPCKGHILHKSINPGAEKNKACEVGDFHGHALTATAAVFESAHPPAVTSGAGAPSGPAPGQHWQMPHSEIDKLVELSENLELDDEYMTPAQAYSAVRETLPADEHLRPVLAALKKPLGSLMQCHGFGACMDTNMFWQHLDETLSNMKIAVAQAEAGRI